MNRVLLTLLSLGLAAANAAAQSTISSASYEILIAPLTGAGGEVGNGSDITAQITVGDPTGGPVSDPTAGGVQIKPSFIGQLFDLTSVAVGASPATIDEGGTRQLDAETLLDDDTILDLAGTDVQWSVLLGPLAAIDASGLATAGLVGGDTAATAQAEYRGTTGQLGLTVLDVDSDNFGAYAGDGLDDGWQIGFFGDPPNADAAPAANPDGDPYDNLFEFLTGYDPNDATSTFSFTMLDTRSFELSKVVPGTLYRMQRSLDLGQDDPWADFTSFTPLSEILGPQISDPDAVGPRSFYRVVVEPAP